MEIGGIEPPSPLMARTSWRVTTTQGIAKRGRHQPTPLGERPHSSMRDTLMPPTREATTLYSMAPSVDRAVRRMTLMTATMVA